MKNIIFNEKVFRTILIDQLDSYHKFLIITHFDNMRRVIELAEYVTVQQLDMCKNGGVPIRPIFHN